MSVVAEMVAVRHGIRDTAMLRDKPGKKGRNQVTAAGADRTGAPLVVVRGGGDLGTGVAHALRSGRLPRRGARDRAPQGRAARRRVRRGRVRRADDGRGGGGAAGSRRRRPGALAGGRGGRQHGRAVVVDPDGALMRALAPDAVVDARMAKRNLGTSRARRCGHRSALGPGFEAGRDVDIVIETNRGPSLGRIIERGAAESDTGVPGEVGGAGAERVLRAPAAGRFRGGARIGDRRARGGRRRERRRRAGHGAHRRAPARPRGGRARPSRRGEKVGDVDPRGAEIDPTAISDKARAVGRAVLAALRARGVQPGAVREGAREAASGSGER